MYYILKVLDNNGVYRPDTIVIGEVELRSPKNDYPEESEAIKISIENNKEKVDVEFNSRVGIIVDANSLEIAEQIANEKFVEVLDIISDELIMSRINLSKSGYIKDLESGEIHPIKDMSYGPGTSFMRATSKFQKIEFSQWLIRQETDLAERYRRSLHWSRNAKWEKNIQIQILFHWFAIEALFKKSELDNIAPLVRWFLGYPNGDLAQFVSPKIINSLKANPIYGQWKTKIIDTLEEIRIFRNNSIHSGFRNVDTPISKLRFYENIMTFGQSRSQRYVRDALSLGLKSLDEFKELLPLVYENNSNLVNDVHHTILYSLNNDHGHIFKKNQYT